MAYSEKVLDHYENPRNVGTFAKDEAEDVGTGLVGAPACGDVMRLQIKVKDGRIEDAKFKTFGCGSAIASSSLATEMIKGMTLDQAAADQEHPDRRGAQPPAGQDPLLGARRGRDQGGDRGLQEEARAVMAHHVDHGQQKPQTPPPAAPLSARRRSRSPRLRRRRSRSSATSAATPNARIRVGVRGGGCTGFTYVFEWADEVKPTDKEFSAHGVVDRRRSEEPRVPRRHDARLRARDDGSRVQVQQPEREGLVRLWRERPVLMTPSGCSGLPAQFDLDPQADRAGVLRADEGAAPRSVRERAGGGARGCAVAVARAQRRVPDAEEAGAARRVPARARRRHDRRQRAARSGVPDGDPRAARGARRGARREANAARSRSCAAR